MPHARAGRVRIHYEELGDRDAPALVLVRGLARSARFWLGFAELLTDRYRVVLLDNRGIGRSDAPLPPYDTASMADDVAAVLDHAGIPRAHVFGISLGGMIAQWVAVKHASRVDRLVLGCTTAGGNAGARPPLAARLALLRGGTMPFHEAMRATAPYVIGPRFLESRPDVVEAWVDIARKEPASFGGLLGQILAAARHSSIRHLARIEAPTLVITGDEDRLIPPLCSYRLAELIPNARLRVMCGAGHDFPTEQPAETVEELRRFLR
jgi:pimeloyl-ACP methyl ester carboxylesterase